MYHEVMREKKKKKTTGINITVSPKAHEVMWKEANRSKPRKTLREQVNIINNIPEEE